jgi:AcrR family transcriptional regulator
MRADARRNQARLLEAAVEMILEIGPEVPLDSIARRAGVGIGTLYRRFPDRESLLHAVAQLVLEQSTTAAETALAEAPDSFEALRHYMHAAVAGGVGVLNLIHPVLRDPDWTEQRATASRLLSEILERGRQNGLIRDEARISDIVFAVIRFSRPVAIGLSRADERAIAHRHLDLYIDGLGSGHHARTTLPELPAGDRSHPP